MRSAFFLLIFLIGISAFAAPDQITRPVNANRTPVRGSVHPRTRAAADAGAADPSMFIDHATLLLKLAPGIEAFLADRQDPASPNYRQWLTPEQFGDRFGLSGNDLGKVADWLRSQGLTVNGLARGRHWITFSGSAAQVGNAFRTQIHRYDAGGEEHFANASDISVPEAFAPLIAGVRGLDNFTMKPMHRDARPLTIPEYNSSGGRHYLSPGDIATIYNVAPLYGSGLDGTGQKIAVIGQTDIDLADIRAFRTRFGLPQNDPQVMLFGTDPHTRAGDLIEADLDLEWTGAVAPNATIVYVNSVSVDLSAQYAVDQNVAPVMTLSYGGCEQGSTDTLRSIAQQANAQGITWLVSSGDGGAATCDYGLAQTPQATLGATVSYPSSIPEITAVGGTEFNEGSGDYWNVSNDANLASAKSYIPERVWNQSISSNAVVGGGGGVSLLFPKPTWQTGPGVPDDKARDLPDISLTASGGHDPYQVVSGGLLYVVGGTSASSPSLAGIVGLLNQALSAKGQTGGQGNINPTLYRMARSNPEAFHDIIEGSNTVQCAQGTLGCVNGLVGYAAAPGYDLASGLGSVDAFNLVTKWNIGAVSTTSLKSDVSSAALADTVNLTATVSGAASIPTGSITFISGDVVLGTAALTAGSKSSTATVAAKVALFAQSDGTVYALYSGDATYAQSSGSAVVALNVPAGDALVVPAILPNPVYGVSGSYPYSIKLVEKAGVGATLTLFTVDGVKQNLSFWTDTSIAPKGTISVSLVGHPANAPVNRVFHFEGTTANGTPWSADQTVPFLPSSAPSLDANIVLSVSPQVTQQNPQADPSCQWQQQVTVQETGGFFVSLASFTAGTTSLTSKLSALFGTTRLAPLGTLTANVCFADMATPSTKTFTLFGLSEDGAVVTATATATFAPAATNPAAASVAPAAVNLRATDSSGTDTGKLDLKFSSGSPAWKVSVAPAGAASKWLSVDSLSGTGAATLTLRASAAGLSNGVYTAVLTVQSSDALPQSIQVPVALTVGASSDISITGVGNAASGMQMFAPGMLLAVYGSNLAPSTSLALSQPLPLTLLGTSATVNGVSAPLWFISPGQINVQIPYEVSAGPAVLGVNNNGKVAQFPFTVAPSGPGIFGFGGFMVPLNSGKRGQTIFGFITGDGDVTPTLPSGATPSAGIRAVSQFPHSRLNVTMTVGGATATIAFNGIVNGLIGVTQLNFTVPPDAPLGVQPVVVTVGGVSSAPVNLTVTD